MSSISFLKSTNEDATRSGTPDEEPVASDSEHELVTVTVPVSDDNLNLGSEPEEEPEKEQEQQTSDVHVQDPKTSGMENLGSDNEEQSLPDSPRRNQRPIRQRKAPSWFGDYVMNMLKAAKETLTRR